MRKIILIYFIMLFFSSLISASCEQGQININNASLKELDNLYGVGPIKAQAIIDSRPFENVDNLIKVNGIGEITLEKILEQNLACVEDEEVSEKVEETSNQSFAKEELNTSKTEKEKNKTFSPEVIKLTPKDIKTEENTKSLNKTDYAKYGFVGFCILIGILLVLKNKKKNGIV